MREYHFPIDMLDERRLLTRRVYFTVPPPLPKANSVECQRLAYVSTFEFLSRHCNICTNDLDDAINFTVGYIEDHLSMSSRCEPVMGKSVTGINGASFYSFL